jgi:SAM-dependent methyltransferase
MPVMQNTPLPSVATARAVARGDVMLTYCDSCQFVWNSAFDMTISLYGEHYENDQTHSARFSDHVDALVDRVAAAVGNGHVVELGCGSGYFLHRLVERSDCTATGYDPSYRGPTSAHDGRLRFVSALYEAEEGAVADVVVCRHVIEHVSRPVELVELMASVLRDGTSTAFLETPAFEWILETVTYQDVFYEHCSYFSEPSMVQALARARLAPTRIDRVFGGQYLWVEASVGAVTPVALSSDMRPAIDRYVGAERDRLARAEEAIRRLGAHGGVAVWGAGAKGVTFVNLLDPTNRLIDCLVDINPAKQSLFTPGTGHPLVAPHELAGRAVVAAIVMNENYLPECAALIETLNLEMTLIVDPR